MASNTKKKIDIKELSNTAKVYEKKTPQDILKLAYKHYDNIAISFSGAEDVVLIDMACKISPKPNIFSLDTGRLHPETYQFIEEVRKHYKINIDIMFPNPAEMEKLVSEKGFFSFYKDGHQECCVIRKVQPLRRKLDSLDAWITGQRRDQSARTRSTVPVVQEDPAFSSPEHHLVKFNPLANWSSKQVWDYIHQNGLPYNKLHARGYTSIGCEPCTRPILPGQHERGGRWWWEEATKKECGLHIKKS